MAADSESAQPTHSPSEGDAFTDLVFTIPGNRGLDDARVMALAEEFHQRLEAEFDTDIGLASHGCNDDFETWHSLVAEMKALRGRLTREALVAAIGHDGEWCHDERPDGACCDAGRIADSVRALVGGC